MDTDKVTRLLRNYPSYRYAVRMYEKDQPVMLQATEYTDMPRGGGFGSRAPKTFDKSLDDLMDYEEYKKSVNYIEGALETLNDEEYSIVKLRWMDDLTLDQIAVRKNTSTSTVKRVHRRALAKLSICLRFAEVPYIESIPA
ncbi:sigma factor-like helix-turn-helix DNA-binding protein [Paenibacillus urinalis]|uniref:sigma factor-like helix-turn-helix DNA-binding protein n=1 Tax=Paenibacillus urinalis TaxID=521520 RepID=UPI00195FF8DF